MPRAPLRTTLCLCFTLLPSCGDDGSTGDDAAASSTGDPAATDTSSGPGVVEDSGSSETGEADSSGGTTGEPAVPYGPCNPDGTCPGGECVSFEAGSQVCMPPCDGEGPAAMCPEPETGSASARCAVNTSSSTMACETSEDCTNPDESCLPTSAGMNCQLAASHCILNCGLPFGDCPDGMICTGAGICQWET